MEENNCKIICPACKGKGRTGIIIGELSMPCPWCIASGYVPTQWEADRIKRILGINEDSEQQILQL